MLTLQSDFSEYEERFEELKENEADLSETTEFLDRVRYETGRLFEELLKTRDEDIRDKWEKFRELRSEALNLLTSFGTSL
jgi:predicted nuclease with TOPRIM domain